MLRKVKKKTEPCPLRAEDVPPPSTTRRDWLSGLRRGSPPEWTELVHRHGPWVYRRLLGWGVREEDARDLVQEVFHEVHTSLHLFGWGGEGQSFRAWLSTITSRVRAKYVEKLLRDPARADLDPAILDGLLSFEPTDEEADDVRAELVWSAFDAVRREFQPATLDTFTLTWFEGLSSDEAAERHGVSRTAVHVARSRVLAAVRRELERTFLAEFPPAVRDAHHLVRSGKQTPEAAARRTGLTVEEVNQGIERVEARLKEALP